MGDETLRFAATPRWAVTKKSQHNLKQGQCMGDATQRLDHKSFPEALNEDTLPDCSPLSSDLFVGTIDCIDRSEIAC